MSTSWWQRFWFNTFLYRLYVRLIVPSFLKSCPQPVRGQVLEVGAGRGWTSRWILETFPQVELTAIDINPEYVVVLKKFEEIYGRRFKAVQGDAESLPFDREMFDMSLSINALGMFPAEKRQQAVRELLRTIRPGGLIGMYEGSLLLPSGLKREVIEKVLREDGCDIISGVGVRHFAIWARKPYPV